MVKDASDLNSSGRLLKVVEISDSRCFFEVCKLNLSLKKSLCSASSKLTQIKSGEVPWKILNPKMHLLHNFLRHRNDRHNFSLLVNKKLGVVLYFLPM